MKKLSKDQEKLIIKYYKSFIKSEKFNKEMKSREQHRKFIMSMLQKNKLKKMTEIDFGELISNLWASGMWGNKDYLVQKIIDDNGIEKIKSQFNDLLYGTISFEKRFDDFMNNIKGLGPASITEILCLFDTTKYSIWNDKARKALANFKLKNIPIRKYQISGKDYKKINEVMASIALTLKNTGLTDSDLLAVDYFLWQIWFEEKNNKNIKEKQDKVSDFDHNEVRDFIKDIGVHLGFETDTEKPIAKGARVDVIWRAKIANLGVVTYVFEVHQKGSIDSLILNLQRALNNPTVQKIIAVSDMNKIKKIKEETKSLPENFRKTLTYWEVSDAINTYEKLSEVIHSINKLELVRSQFLD